MHEPAAHRARACRLVPDPLTRHGVPSWLLTTHDVPLWTKASLVPSAARGRRNPRAADVSRSAVDVDERVVERLLEQIVEACCAHARVDGDVGLDAAGVQHEPGLAAPALVVGTPAALRVV